MYTLLTASETSEEIVEAAQETVQEVNKLTEYLQSKFPDIIGFGIKVILALVVFEIGRRLIKWIRKLVRVSMEKSSVDKGVEQFFKNAVYRSHTRCRL